MLVDRQNQCFISNGLRKIHLVCCFEIEKRLRAALNIPVFHNDQHGTAVVCLAGLINALKVVGKKIENVSIVIKVKNILIPLCVGYII
jgi:malate dehydrogenase (oxaloacetate-decarboxylating)